MDKLMEEHKKLNPIYTGSAVAPLPTFPERDAVIAYNAAAKVLHGEFAFMNNIPPITMEGTNEK